MDRHLGGFHLLPMMYFLFWPTLLFPILTWSYLNEQNPGGVWEAVNAICEQTSSSYWDLGTSQWVPRLHFFWKSHTRRLRIQKWLLCALCSYLYLCHPTTVQQRWSAGHHPRALSLGHEDAWVLGKRLVGYNWPVGYNLYCHIYKLSSLEIFKHA